MKKFRFRLSTVEKLRERAEKAALRIFSEQQRVLKDLENQRANLYQALKNSLTRRENLGADKTKISLFQMENDFINGTKQRIVQVEHIISKALKKLDRLKTKYLEERKKRMMITRLREKEYARFKKSLHKMEAKSMDELVVLRHGMKERVSS